MDNAIIEHLIKWSELSLRHRMWTNQELKYLCENVGELGYEEVAATLGRSYNAVRVKAVRIGSPTSTHNTEYLSANKASALLGIDNHKCSIWMRSGIMPGSIAPTARGAVWRIHITALKRWVITPTSWLYVKPDEIPTQHLRRLAILAKVRWGDEWLDTDHVARVLGCTPGYLVSMLRRGLIRGGVQARNVSSEKKNQAWCFWYMRRSDVEHVRWPLIGFHWTPAQDAFLLKARDEWHLTYATIKALMKSTQCIATIRGRYKKLKTCQ